MSINVNPLRQIAKELGFAGNGGEGTWGYARLLEAAEAAYWTNREAVIAAQKRRKS